jgi:hypothetical protein
MCRSGPRFQRGESPSTVSPPRALELEGLGTSLEVMALSDFRRMQRAWSGRLLIVAVVVAFLSIGTIANACALAAAATTSTSHCGECPDQDSGKTCPGTALCVFAGTALMESDATPVSTVVHTPEPIESEGSRSASIFLIPPDPPPISG